MFDKYNNIYQMNALRKTMGSMFKFKKMNVCLDEEWTLCDMNNQTPTRITSNSEYKYMNSLSTSDKIAKIDTPKIKSKQINTILKVNTTQLHVGWFSLLYESFMDMIAEIDVLQVFLFFDEKRMPCITI
jgi:hypothetical protein